VAFGPTLGRAGRPSIASNDVDRKQAGSGREEPHVLPVSSLRHRGHVLLGSPRPIPNPSNRSSIPCSLPLARTTILRTPVRPQPPHHEAEPGHIDSGLRPQSWLGESRGQRSGQRTRNKKVVGSIPTGGSTQNPRSADHSAAWGFFRPCRRGAECPGMPPIRATAFPQVLVDQVTVAVHHHRRRGVSQDALDAGRPASCVSVVGSGPQISRTRPRRESSSTARSVSAATSSTPTREIGLLPRPNTKGLPDDPTVWVMMFAWRGRAS
jgi:hypothetical protein